MSTRASVIAWILLTACVAAYGGFRLKSQDQTAYLPGPTSNGHHQIEMACASCHTPFNGVTNEACLKCHGEQRTAADSHPESKFNDPRNADRVAKLDARKCTTCHAEHWPEGTHREGYTLPIDFCVECHADVGTERPSHEGISFTTCSDAGCHNYHDNRGLWEDYLKKHIGEPKMLAKPEVPVRNPTTLPSRHKPLIAKDQDAPRTVSMSVALVSDWEESSHAKVGINCSGCHGGKNGAAWENKPSLTVCATCHAPEDKGFREGRHGMRVAAGLGPMSPGRARLPMKPEAKDRELGCHSCHGTHKYDTSQAAIYSCLGCHDDEHSKNYLRSPHFKAWEAESSSKSPRGTGVSCATCHMPREKRQNAPVAVQHNQNDNLRPSDKMVRNVCTSCHGVNFSLDSIADPDLIRQNFDGQPKTHVASIEMVEKRAQGKR